jgi:O-antigen ligase
MAATRADRLAAPAAAVAANAVLVALALARPATAVVLAAVVLVVAAALAAPGAVLLACAGGLVVSADLLDLVASFPSLSIGGLQIVLTDLFVAAALLAWAGAELHGGARIPLRSLAAEPAFALGVLFLLLGAYDLGRGGYGTMSSVRLFGYCIAVPLVVRTLDSPPRLRALGRAVVAGGVVTSATAIAMIASGRSVTEHGLSTGGIRGLSIGGSFLVGAALLYVLADVTAGGRRITPSSALLVLVLAGGVAASGARETWIGVAGALALFGIASPLRGGVRLVLALVLSGALAFGAYSIAPHPPQLQERLAAVEHRLLSVGQASADPSLEVRYDKWRIVWAQLRAHPFLGTGFGYPATYTSNIGGSNFVRAYVDDPENTQLWLWARMGTIGFAVWVGFNGIVLLTLLRFVRAPAAAARTAALWGAGILVVVWAGMVFSPVSAFGSTLLLYWFGVSLAPVARHLAGR